MNNPQLNREIPLKSDRMPNWCNFKFKQLLSNGAPTYRKKKVHQSMEEPKIIFSRQAKLTEVPI